MHEVARFNQTFYPYACVLFSADCAARRYAAACHITALGPAVDACVQARVVGFARAVVGCATVGVRRALVLALRMRGDVPRRKM
ncbi:hypothetical protein XAC2852_790084 [Xanthomonas citri pv. citri]|nr:hypothetical protein XAC2852_790084 [Xanthomonas citri pv. citri]CEH90927.1 hypothetical protein XACB100_1980014 [Xanthomonas citri pv. citri]CEI35573.1 hypothetical protein XACJJ10_1630015 [Xanthomonas citri pv. citri]CEL39612.1 hypothetical protein XACJK4_2280083 [Xanthomonas citri pv. citri]